MNEENENQFGSFAELENKAQRLEAFINLSNFLRDKERRLPMHFNDFLYLASTKPEYVFRDIFQLFHDMIHFYVPEGVDEYNKSSESIGFVDYDSSRLFVENCDNPFFADRLFMNRFMDLVDSFRQGAQFNYIYLFEGPPGSGKSTFLNNLLNKFEEYSKTDEGTVFKIYWRLDIKRLGGFKRFKRKFTQSLVEEIAPHEPAKPMVSGMSQSEYPEKYLEFSCPNHDHPIFLIPKYYRKQFLDELITDEEFKSKLFNDNEYEWVMKGIPCNICSSIYSSLLDMVGDPKEVYSMIYARKNFYGRQFGEGISVFNPGDPIITEPISIPVLQNMINDLLKNDDVRFKYSYLAKTNNGILALMDIKERNVERLKEYHGIISDGVHKIDLAEEYIKSLIVGLINPEDTIHYEKVKSFQDRIITVNIPYVLDYKTEVSIYKGHFGEKIVNKFLPRVLDNFARIIISTRLDKDSPTIKKWLINPEKYSKYMDKNWLLLKMTIYTGKIPDWLSEDDLKRFDKNTRKSLVAESEYEGMRGFSGRQSLTVFNNFYSQYTENGKLITMNDVRDYFMQKKEMLDKGLPDGFIDSLVDMYDYNVLQEVKEAIYYYNETQISREIQNYLFAINFEPGETKKSEYTGDMIEISEDYFKNFEALFLGTTSTSIQRMYFRKDVHAEYITKTLAQELRNEGKKINETEQFKALFERYIRNLKENALLPYQDNDTFRRSLRDWGTENYKSYDEKLKRDVARLLNNLQSKFNYTIEGARQVSSYVLEKNLARKY